MSRHHLTRICSFLSRPWGLIRLGVWGFILIRQPKKTLKDIVRHYQPFTQTFWLSLKTKLKRQLPNMPRNHIQKNQYSFTGKCSGPQMQSI